jgi:hypothetical protein
MRRSQNKKKKTWVLTIDPPVEIEYIIQDRSGIPESSD